MYEFVIIYKNTMKSKKLIVQVFTKGYFIMIRRAWLIANDYC